MRVQYEVSSLPTLMKLFSAAQRTMLTQPRRAMSSGTSSSSTLAVGEDEELVEGAERRALK